MSPLLEALRGQAWGDYLVWCVMLGILGAMIVVFRRQDRSETMKAADPSPESQAGLLSMLVARGRILCLLWGLLLVTLVIEGLQHPSNPTRASAEAALAPAAIAAAPESVAQAADGPAVLAQVPALARDALIDRIKSFYEDAFVAYYYLNKCNAGSPTDNQTLYSAMIAELHSQGAEAEASKVIDAARGSFEVIYSESPCDARYLSPVKSRFETMMTALPTRRNVGTRAN